MVQYSTTDVEGRAHGAKILVYGKGGSGKTTLAKTCPKPLVVSAESGLLALRRQSLDCAKVESMADLRQILADAQDAEFRAYFKTLFLDSISEIAEIVLGDAKGRHSDGRQAYGVMQEELIDVVKTFRDLPGFHVVMTAKEVTRLDATGIPRTQPLMPGQNLGPALPYLFDEVFRACVAKNKDGENVHWLQTQPDEIIEAKDRSGSLRAVEPMDIGAIIAKILKN